MIAGSTWLQLNEFEQARKDLDTALRLDPRLPGIYTLAGTARDKTGDVKEAEVAFRDALRLNPNDFDANLYLGAILYKRREMDEARIYLNKALQINPSSSMAQYESAMLKSKMGEYQSAADDLEKLVKSAPDPAWLEPHIELATLYHYKLIVLRMAPRSGSWSKSLPRNSRRRVRASPDPSANVCIIP